MVTDVGAAFVKTKAMWKRKAAGLFQKGPRVLRVVALAAQEAHSTCVECLAHQFAGGMSPDGRRRVARWSGLSELIITVAGPNM